MSEQFDKNALKVQALTQRISELVSQYENSHADLRVEYTLEVASRDAQIQSLTEQLQVANEELARLQEPTDVAQEEISTDHHKD